MTNDVHYFGKTMPFVKRHETKNMDIFRVRDDIMLVAHPSTACEFDATCCLHKPSRHTMIDFPQHWREDRGLMERTCEHGVGHPDPDDLEFKRRTLGHKAARAEAVHGCDGCCDGAYPLRLFIDDERNTPPEYNASARTEAIAIEVLERAKAIGRPFKLVSFDYDAHSYLNHTFESVAVWLKENDYWPEEVRIHTLNSWHGRPWLEKFFDENAPESTFIDTSDPWDIDAIIDGTAPAWAREFQDANS